MEREAADVVVPVAGSAEEVRAVLARMRGLRLRPGDTLTVVDNRGAGVDEPDVLVATRCATLLPRAQRRRRCAGTRRGSCSSTPTSRRRADLLDRLLAPPPADARRRASRAPSLDEPPASDAPAAVRYACAASAR